MKKNEIGISEAATIAKYLFDELKVDVKTNPEGADAVLDAAARLAQQRQNTGSGTRFPSSSKQLNNI